MNVNKKLIKAKENLIKAQKKYQKKQAKKLAQKLKNGITEVNAVEIRLNEELLVSAIILKKGDTFIQYLTIFVHEDAEELNNYSLFSELNEIVETNQEYSEVSNLYFSEILNLDLEAFVQVYDTSEV